MNRRRFLVAAAAATTLAGCASDGNAGGEPTDTSTDGSRTTTTEPAAATTESTAEPTAETTTETAAETTAEPATTTQTGADYLAYLFTADGLGDGWTRTVQRTDSTYVERGFENGETGRRLAVGVRFEDGVAAAADTIAEMAEQFENGDRLDGETIGEETYVAYPPEFETGVLFRVGRAIGVVALGDADPTLDEAVARGEALRANLP